MPPEMMGRDRECQALSLSFYPEFSCFSIFPIFMITCVKERVGNDGEESF